MKNTREIIDICGQAKKATECIETLAIGIEQFENNATGIAAMYKEMINDELDRMQALTLALTRMIVNEDREYSSTFLEGELTETPEESDKDNG